LFALTTHDEKAFIDAFEKMIVAVNEEEHVIASIRTDNAFSLSAEKLGFGESVYRRQTEHLKQRRKTA
jgi:hypothetical protein